MLEKLKKLFFELYQENNNLSEQEILQLQKYLSKIITLKDIMEVAVKNDFLPVIKCFVESGYSPYFVIENKIAGFKETRNILNIAAEENSLNIIKYLLGNNIFIADQRASQESITPFHSAIENGNIEAAELLLKKGADINAEYFWHNNSYSILLCLLICKCNTYGLEIAKFLIKHGVNIPDNIRALCSSIEAQKYHSNNIVEDFLLSVKKLDDLYNNFINGYKTASSEIQEAYCTRTGIDLTDLKEKSKSLNHSTISDVNAESESINMLGATVDNQTNFTSLYI